MSETLGHFQMRVSLLPVGAKVHPDTLAGLVNDRIEQICRMTEWTRLERETVLQTVAEYSTGTVAIDADTTFLVGTNTAWTDAMTGRLIRIANQLEFYTFSYVSATTGNIDRNYEHEDTSGAYRIWQPFYELPVDLESIKSLRNLTLGFDLEQETREYLNRMSPTRIEHNTPRLFVPAEDSAAEQPQIELYPGPINAEGLPMRWRMQAPLFQGVSNAIAAQEFPDWISIPAIMAGVKASLYGDAGQSAMAMGEERNFEKLVAQMMGEDARRRPASSLQQADRYVLHRVRRATRRRGEMDIVNWNDAG